MDNRQWFWAGFTVCALIWFIYNIVKIYTLDKKQVAKPEPKQCGEKSPTVLNAIRKQDKEE